MGLPDNRNDRDFAKYREPTGRPGETAVAVVGPDGGTIGGTGGTSMVDDAAFTPGGSSITPMGALADETAADAVDEGDIGAVRMTLTRALHVNLRDASGAEVAVGGGTQYDEDTAHAGAEKLTMAGVVRKDAAASLVGTDADRTELIVDQNGKLWVNTAALETLLDAIKTAVETLDNVVAGAEAQVDVVTSALPTGAATAAKQDTQTTELQAHTASLSVLDDWDESDRAKVNLIAGQAGITAGAGTVAANTPRVTHASDDPVTTAVQLLDDAVVQDDAGFTPGTTKVHMAGFQADETSTDSVDEGDGGAARMTLDRKLIVTLAPHTKGGTSTFRSLDLDETEEDVKTSAGQVYWIYAMNLSNSLRYLKLYNNTAANVVVGTDTPKLTFPIPANNDMDGAGFFMNVPQGIEFTTAICVAATTGLADNDTGAPGANEVVVNIGYL
jgi:hypothetical protein